MDIPLESISIPLLVSEIGKINFDMTYFNVIKKKYKFELFILFSHHFDVFWNVIFWKKKINWNVIFGNLY